MERIQSYDELLKLSQKYAENLKMRKPTYEDEMAAENKRCTRFITVCGGTGCKSSDSDRIILRLQEEIKIAGLEDEVTVSVTGCFGNA